MTETPMKHKTTLEAYLELPEKPVIYRHTEIEWREDGPYSVKTGKKVAVISTPRDMRTKK